MNIISANIILKCRINIDIKLSVYDTFLELPSSGTLNIEGLEKNLI
jgi:hypothetical protein